MSPSIEDEGYFECTAVNDVGEERRVIEVTLQGIDLAFCTISRQQRVLGDDRIDTFAVFSFSPSIY